MRAVWLSMAVTATVDTSPSIPSSAAVNDSTDAKSTSTTLTVASCPSGFLDRLRTVILKFASMSALRT
jgi:hypothetical protein